MVVFVTLFLGLVAGIQPVELSVSGDVAALELILDGQIVGSLHGEPWVLPVDLGEDLAPHHLVAVGRNAAGEEVSRVEQWINLPRPRTEVRLVPAEPVEGRSPSVALHWGSVDAVTPDRLEVRFDGELLDATDPTRIDLPAYDPAGIHLLQAEVVVGDEVTRTEMVVGGEGSAVTSDLTAVPVTLTGGRLPEAEELEGLLTRGGEPLRVVAVEQSPAEILMVQDLGYRHQGQLKRLQQDALRPRASARLRPTGLKSGDRFRLLIPIPAVVSEETRSVQFPMSPDLWAAQKEVYSTGAASGSRSIPDAIPRGLLAAIPALPAQKADTTDQRLADAVATAALAATAERRPRMVILLLGEDAADGSRFSSAAVRDYLRRLQVPLRVWSPRAEKVDSGWGEVQDVSTYVELFRAFREVRSFLEEQAVVWAEGRHLPQEIRVEEREGSPIRPLHEGLAAVEDDGLGEGLEAPAEPAVQVAEGESPLASPSPAGEELSGTTAAAASGRVFGEWLEVREVTVEVIVTDRRGRIVRDLTEEDFRLLEDGQEVAIERFRPPPPAPPEAGPAGEAEAAEVPEAVPTPAAMVVFLDLFNLHRSTVPRVLRELQAGLEEGTPGLEAMLVTYDGRLEITQGFTSDLSLIRKGLEAAAERPPVLRSRLSAEGRLLNEMSAVRNDFESAERLSGRDREMAIAAAQARRSAAFAQLRPAGEERVIEIKSVLNLLGQLVASLGGLEGKKMILYAGDRLSIQPGSFLYQEAASLAQIHPDGGGGGDLALSRIEGEGQGLDASQAFRRLQEQANANGVTLYAVTPMNAPDPYGAERAGLGEPGAALRADTSRDEGVRAGACALAGPTGGVCRVGATEIEPGIQAVFDDIRGAYVLSYTPARDPDGKVHEIGVRIEGDAGKGLRLRHRESYLDKPRGDRLQDRVLSALLFDAEENPLGVEITLADPRPVPEQELVLVPVELRMAVSGLALLPNEAGDARRATCKLYVATLAADGRTTAVQEFPVTFQVSEEQIQGVPGLRYTHRVPIALAPGTKAIAIGFWDEVGRTGSFLRRQVSLRPQAEAPADTAAPAAR